MLTLPGCVDGRRNSNEECGMRNEELKFNTPHSSFNIIRRDGSLTLSCCRIICWGCCSCFWAQACSMRPATAIVNKMLLFISFNLLSTFKTEKAARLQKYC